MMLTGLELTRKQFPLKTPWWSRRKPLRQWGRATTNFMLAAKDRVALLARKLLRDRLVIETRNLDRLVGETVVVFATFPTGPRSPCHARLLRAFEARGYTILLVSNRHESVGELNEELGPDWPQIYRRPFGRDFGCYQEACLRLYEILDAGGYVSRVILLNDSFLTFPGSEALIVDHLADDRFDFSGLTETHEVQFHVGSFALAMSGKAFFHPIVRAFWENYVPISTRLHSITNGEMGLTAALLSAGFNPNVLHSPKNVRACLREMPLDKLGRLASLLPDKFFQVAGELYQEFEQIRLGASSSSAESIAFVRGKLEASLVEFAFSASPVHLGAALIMATSKPILKKDVVWRMMVAPAELRDLIALAEPGLTAGEVDQVCEVILAKGHPANRSTWQRILFQWSII